MTALLAPLLLTLFPALFALLLAFLLPFFPALCPTLLAPFLPGLLAVASAAVCALATVSGPVATSISPLAHAILLPL